MGVHRAPRSVEPVVAVRRRRVLVPSPMVGFVLWTSAAAGPASSRAGRRGAGRRRPTREETPPRRPRPRARPRRTEEAPAEEPAAAGRPTWPRPSRAQRGETGGLAGSTSRRPRTPGFTAVTAGNGNAGGAPTTIVFYGTPEDSPDGAAGRDDPRLTTVRSPRRRRGTASSLVLAATSRLTDGARATGRRVGAAH